MKEKLQKLHELTDQFKTNFIQYKNTNYDEANTRVDFIDKFFELLDWDVRNKLGFSEDYRDVVREDKVIIQGKPKAPDYSFRIGKERKFFVEAKKPSVNIKKDIAPAYQVRRYGYTAKVPLSILTDFEEFAVYDTRIKPSPNDKASVARIFYCTFDEYEKNFEFIYNTFAKNSILRGSFDRYVKANKNKRGTSEVDNEFLKLIENWRNNLAKNIALRNKDLSIYNLNTAVQKTIDRIIFLRIAEDRNMETYGTLQNLTKLENIYENLVKIFIRADKKYNSGLFQKSKWLNELQIDHKILKKIIQEIYYPKCPYELSIMPIETLGNIYEQFLGKIIRLTPSHQAKVEEKPEVKKAGGVYYTPQYIIEYIVKNTVGEKISNKSPDNINEIKILDPACGSGSFLVGTYQYLLDHRLKFYTEKKNIKTALKKGIIYQVDAETFRLSIAEKKSILLNNIFGVDIDKQAGEVTKLSLLLKLMENENSEYSDSLFKHSDLKILPNLSDNIKCGNSLIGSDFYDNTQIDMFNDAEIRKINVFDWEKEFSDILGNGGFDCVIGNPPYVKEYTDKTAFQFKDGKLKKYYQGKMDLWYSFACFSIDLLKRNGLHSFIATNNWITSAGASIFRNKLLSESRILKFVDFSDFKVFENASIQTMIYVIKKEKQSKKYKVKYTRILNKNILVQDLKDRLNTNIRKIKEKNTINYEWFNAVIVPNELIDKTISFIDSNINKVIEKIKGNGNYYFNKFNVANGIHTHHSLVTKKMLNLLNSDFTVGDGIFELSDKEKQKLHLTEKENELLKPLYTSNELQRYNANNNNKNWLIYTDSSFKNKRKIESFPNIKNHLDKFKVVITSDNKPYGLHRSREERFFKNEKIAVLRKSKFPKFTYINFDSYILAEFYIIKPEDINLKYLTAILNSKLVHFWLYYKGKKQGDQLQIDKAPLLEIPLIKTENQNVKNKLVSFVDQMLEVQKKYHSATSEDDKKFHKQKIDILDRQIDKLVYGLYGLTDEEIKIVEG